MRMSAAFSLTSAIMARKETNGSYDTGSTEGLCPCCSNNGTIIGTSIKVDVYECPSCRLCYLPASVRPKSEMENHWYAGMDSTQDADRYLSDMGDAYRKQLEILWKMV